MNQSLLIQATKDNRIKIVQKLLESIEVDVNVIDSHGKSALRYAIEKNHWEIVKILLDFKASVYLKDPNNKIIADYVIEDRNKQYKISELVIERILKDSVAVLEDCKKFEEDSAAEESPAEHTQAEIENGTEFKALVKRLENPQSTIYMAANTFLIFLDTFCTGTTNEVALDILNKLKYLRVALLKRKNLTPKIIIKVIECCTPTFTTERPYHECNDKAIQFFINMAEFLKSLKDNKQFSGINTHFNYKNEKQINDIINSEKLDEESMDDEFKNQLKSWILKAYSNDQTDVQWEQHWFEFNVNIYPNFIRESHQQNKDLLEKEMSQLRKNFVHSVGTVLEKYWIQNFKEFIVKLKGKILEYFYGKKLHKWLYVSSLHCEGRGLKFKELIKKDFEVIRNEINCDGIYEDCFASKFEKSLFPCTVVSNTYLDQSLIEDYFFFIPAIEHLNEAVRDKINYCSNNFDYTEKIVGTKLLNDFSRRCFFEQYINVKRYKQRNDKINYKKEKESLINGLLVYSTDEECVENMFKHHLDKEISFAISSVAKDVYNFVRDLAGVNKLCTEAKEVDIVRLIKIIFRDPTDQSQVPKAFEVIPNLIPNIEKQYFGIFTSVKIAGVDVDVKKTIMSMFKTFYNAFDEYRIVTNVADLFKRKTFLNAFSYGLLGSKRPVLYENIIKIDYMSPFIAMCIQSWKIHNNNALLDSYLNEALMKQLIEYLIEEECLNYLNILLTVKSSNSDIFDPFDLLLDVIEKKKTNVQCINRIFNNFCHIEGFAKALTSRRKIFQNAYNDEVYNDFVKRVIIPFLKLVNLKAMNQFFCTRGYYFRTNNLHKSIPGYDKARDILSISEKIEEQFSNEILTVCHVHCIERDLLNAKISNAKANFEESTDFIESAIKKLNRCTISEHNEIHGVYKLLTLLIRYFIIKANIANVSLEVKQENNSHEINIISSLKNLYDNIVSKICRKRGGFENILYNYQEIINDEIYKKLLTTSELLSSEKSFNINNIALSVAFFTSRKYRLGPRSSSDDTELQRTLDILESVHTRLANRETIEFVKHVGNIYKKISLQRLSSDHATRLLYCLKALTRFNMYYNVGKVTPAIFSRSAIEKSVMDLLHEYIVTQYEYAKDLNLGLYELTQVYCVCTQVVKGIKNCSANKKLFEHYLKILSITADVCQDCGFESKRQGNPDWKKFYREAIDHANSMIEMHKLVGNPDDKCCEDSVKAIDNIERVLGYFDQAESSFQEIIVQMNNPPLCCKNNKIKQESCN